MRKDCPKPGESRYKPLSPQVNAPAALDLGTRRLPEGAPVNFVRSDSLEIVKEFIEDAKANGKSAKAGELLVPRFLWSEQIWLGKLVSSLEKM